MYVSLSSKSSSSSSHLRPITCPVDQHWHPEEDTYSSKSGYSMYSMLRNSPAVIGKYGGNRDKFPLCGSTFLIENEFNFQNEPCPPNFKITKHSCLCVKWKGTNLSPIASDFMSLHFLHFLSM